MGINRLEMEKNQKFRGYLIILKLLTGAILISFSSVWVNIARVTPTVSAFYRVFFGFVFLCIASLLGREISRTRNRKHLLVAACGVLFALDLFFWHASILYIGPGLATILGNFQVFILTFVGILYYREKMSKRFLFSIIAAVIGLFFIIGINRETLSGNYGLGILYGLITAVCYSGFLLTLKKLQSDNGKPAFFYYLMMVSLASSIILGIQILVSGQTFRIPDLQSLSALIALGLLSQVIGWVIIANALPGIRASIAGLILLLQPALAFCWDVLLFHRPTTGLNWLGVSITLVAIWLGMAARPRD